MNLGPGLIFGNFLAESRDGELIAECINTNDTKVEIAVPSIELIPCEGIAADTYNTCENGTKINNEQLIDYVSINRLFNNNDTARKGNGPNSNIKNNYKKNDNKKKLERAELIVKLVDTKGYNQEEIEHVQTRS